MKILHLYHDIMNLYGEYANVLAARDIIKKCGENCEVEEKTLCDDVNFEDYDFVYIGSGTERNQKVVLEDFKRISEGFKNYVDGGKTALLTGNSFEMLGSSITDCCGKVYEGIDLFDFRTTEQNKTRYTADAIFEADFLERPLVGFINKCSETEGIDTPMFTVKMGLGNSSDSSGEGVRLNNLFCTHLTGPVLMKNPEFLKYIAKMITGTETEVSEIQQKSYDVTLSELMKRLEE